MRHENVITVEKPQGPAPSRPEGTQPGGRLPNGGAWPGPTVALIAGLLAGCEADHAGPTRGGEDVVDRYVVMPELVEGEDAEVTVIDRASGEVVLRTPTGDGGDLFAVRLDPSGDSFWVLVADFDVDDGADGVLRRIDRDGNVLEEVPAPMGHNAFTIRSATDGTHLTYIRAVIVPNPSTAEGDDAYVNYDEVVDVGPDGVETVLFDSSEVLAVLDFQDGDMDGTPVAEVCAEEGVVPGSQECVHGNALNFDASTGTWLFSTAINDTLFAFDELGRLSAYTGAVDGIDLLTHSSAYTTSAYPILQGGRFSFQHGANRATDGTLWLLDNHDDFAEASTVEQYSVDSAASSITLLRDIGAPPHAHDPHAFFLGGVVEATGLRAGNIVAAWGTAACADEVDPEGTVVWDYCPGAGHTLAEPTFVPEGASVLSY